MATGAYKERLGRPAKKIEYADYGQCSVSPRPIRRCRPGYALVFGILTVRNQQQVQPVVQAERNAAASYKIVSQVVC